MNQALNRWIAEIKELCQPDQVHLCDGSQEEYETLCSQMVRGGTMVPLKRPKSFLCRSTADDVARLESRTFICSKTKSDAGPTNNWKEPEEMRQLLRRLFS